MLMIGAAVIEVFYGVDAERQPLERIAGPLAAE
jgi:hypothetical protein